jgi:CRISPR-associated protein Cmr2
MKASSDAGLSRVARKDLPCVEHFPFDASILLSSRWEAVFKEQGLAGDSATWGGQHVKPLFSKLLEPYPYVACLVADGDRMGRAIDSLTSADGHRAFSKAIAGFADEARSVVEQQHRGTLVYAGCDDVLAFLPLPQALGCADGLRKAFAGAMATACMSIPSEHQPTLSVGLGVGHVMESMGDLLTLGRQAERDAKRDRNALAVLVDKRSGGAHVWRAGWSVDPVRSLNKAIALLQDRLPSRKVYEISHILARLPKPENGREQGWARVLALEVERAFRRVEGGSLRPLRPEDAGLALDVEAGYLTLHARVQRWISSVLIARTFARAALHQRHNVEAAA